jgi:septin 7
MSDSEESAAAVANGHPQARGSPAPNIPNGKPTSPYVKESNPMGSAAAQTVSSKDPKAAAAAANDMRNVVRRKLTGYVGFANLPNQWHRKSVRKGFNFNVMVVGMSTPFPLHNTADHCR